MINKIKNNPLITAFSIITLYAFWFLSPIIFGLDKPNTHNLNGIEEGIMQWKNQLIISTVLIAILSLLGWWRAIGLKKMNAGSIKFLLPIFLLSLLFLNIAWVLDENPQNWFAGFKSSSQFFTLLLIMLTLGFTEEGIFRGILFYGLKSKFAPFYTILLSALIFGLFHYVNLIVGKPLGETSYQVIHAMGMGFLYASLRLRIGAIWPLMILHALWDFSLFTLQTVQSQIDPNSVKQITAFSAIGAFTLALPALSYGLFVYWRWSKTHDKKLYS